jgi:hypothetical protein
MAKFWPGRIGVLVAVEPFDPVAGMFRVGVGMDATPGDALPPPPFPLLPEPEPGLGVEVAVTEEELWPSFFATNVNVYC